MRGQWMLSISQCCYGDGIGDLLFFELDTGYTGSVLSVPRMCAIRKCQYLFRRSCPHV